MSPRAPGRPQELKAGGGIVVVSDSDGGGDGAWGAGKGQRDAATVATVWFFLLLGLGFGANALRRVPKCAHAVVSPTSLPVPPKHAVHPSRPARPSPCPCPCPPRFELAMVQRMPLSKRALALLDGTPGGPPRRRLPPLAADALRAVSDLNPLELLFVRLSLPFPALRVRCSAAAAPAR